MTNSNIAAIEKQPAILPDGTEFLCLTNASEVRVLIISSECSDSCFSSDGRWRGKVRTAPHTTLFHPDYSPEARSSRRKRKRRGNPRDGDGDGRASFPSPLVQPVNSFRLKPRVMQICDECQDQLHQGTFSNFCSECLTIWENHERSKMIENGLVENHFTMTNDE